MKLNFKILFILFVLFPEGIYSQESRASEYIKGLAYYQNGKPDSAIEAFERSIRLDKTNEDTYLYLGLSFLELNKLDPAIENFRKCDELKKGKASLYMAKAYARSGNLTDCLEQLDIHLHSPYKVPESKIFLDPDFEKFEEMKSWIEFWNEGNFYSGFDKVMAEADYNINNGNFIEALSIINEGLEKGYRKSALLAKRAEIYLRLDNRKLALDDLDQAVSADRRNAELLKIRGQVNYDLEKYSQSLEDIQAAMKYDPVDLSLYIDRARVLQKTGDMISAQEDMNFYLDLFPGDDRALYLFARTYMDEGLYLDALKYLNRCLKIDPYRPEYFASRGESYFHARTYRKADEDLGMSLDLDPENSNAYYLKGLANIKLGNRDHACYCFKKAFELGKKEAYDELGKSCPDFFK